jgi:hypothetical protein
MGFNKIKLSVGRNNVGRNNCLTIPYPIKKVVMRKSCFEPWQGPTRKKKGAIV